jgi:hypothetical protein
MRATDDAGKNLSIFDSLKGVKAAIKNGGLNPTAFRESARIISARRMKA